MPEDPDIQRLVAQSLQRLGFPAQRFHIAASFLRVSPMDLALMVRWPLKFRRSGKPTGVIQIGTPKREWNPETKTIIVFARLMDGDRLAKEINEWMVTCAALVRAECKARGATWPNEWPHQLKITGRDETRLRSMGYVVQTGELITRGKAKKRKKEKVA